VRPDVCPNCGAEIPPKATACPECGSDESTGWSIDAETGGLDLPDSQFDYADFVNREFGREGPVPRGIHPAWWVVAVLLVGCLVYFLVR
jgi:hypothetical protein